MVGATAAEVAAMKPEGWLMLPFPDGRQGFHLLDPGHPAGVSGSISFHFGTPGYRTFTVRPSPAEFVLNEALELPALGTLARDFASDSEGRPTAADISVLAGTIGKLIRSRLLRVWEDLLDDEPARLLRRRDAVIAVASQLNGVVSSGDGSGERAASVLFVDATEKGRRVLRKSDTAPRGSKWH